MYSIAAHLSAFSCPASFVAKVPEVFFGEQEAKAVSERGKEEGGAWWPVTAAGCQRFNGTIGDWFILK